MKKHLGAIFALPVAALAAFLIYKGLPVIILLIVAVIFYIILGFSEYKKRKKNLKLREENADKIINASKKVTSENTSISEEPVSVKDNVSDENTDLKNVVVDETIIPRQTKPEVK